MSSDSQLTDAEVAAFNAQGFEIGMHINTGCLDFTPSELDSTYSTQLGAFGSRYPSLPSPATSRTHCIVWSDWATQPQIERQYGIRLDTNYYYWPGSWVVDRPGFFTGSGMPMRFADLEGTIIDVFQAATQMTDESLQTYPATINALLDKALGPEGFYGAFTANMHTDLVTSPESDAIIASAQARGVPVVSARQMLEWLDGRNGSSFGSLTYTNGVLGFSIAVGTGARNLQAMLPKQFSTRTLTGLTHTGTPVSYTTRTVKGVQYAFFPANAGAYQATYSPDTTPPAVSVTNPSNGAIVGGTISITADATDNVGVAGVRFLVDGANLGTEDTTPPFSTSWDTTTVPDGPHRLAAVARDGVGNATSSAVVSVSVDNSPAPPDTRITAHPDHPSHSAEASFSFTSTKPGSRFECQLDGSGFRACTSPKAYAGLDYGAHTFEVRAIDAAGHPDPTPASYQWTIYSAVFLPMIMR